MSRSSCVRVALVLLLGAAALRVDAQQWGWRAAEGWSGGRHQREMVPSERKGFYGCKLWYDQVRFEEGGRGWDTDYPRGIRNLMWRLGEFTTTAINTYGEEEMADGVVRPTDEGLFACPFLIGSDVGTASFSADEVAALRDYFLKGGFLWVDDFWGTRAMEHWLAELDRILPEYERVTIDGDHPLMSTFYFIDEIPQIANIGFWRRSRGQTSERGSDSQQPSITAVLDETGRAMVVMTHNTDIGDGMEREGDDQEFFLRFSPPAYAVAINIAIYGMTR